MMEIRAYKGIDGRYHFEYWEFDEALKGWQIVDKNSVEVDCFNNSFEFLVFSDTSELENGKIVIIELKKWQTWEIIKLAKRQFLRDFVDSKMVNHKQDSSEDSSK